MMVLILLLREPKLLPESLNSSRLNTQSSIQTHPSLSCLSDSGSDFDSHSFIEGQSTNFFLNTIQQNEPINSTNKPESIELDWILDEDESDYYIFDSNQESHRPIISQEKLTRI
jgi:hypothetical protein